MNFRLHIGRGLARLAPLSIAALLALFANAVSAAQLSGSSTTAGSSYDLTANSADWVHFGYVPIPLDRKRGVAEQITDYSSIANADPGSTDKVETGFSWTDGLSPVQTIVSTSTGKRVFRRGKGFRFTVPAKTSMRTLKVYVGAWSARGTLTARLSDGSAATFTTSIDNRTGYLGRVVTLNFRAASNSATLQVDYVVAQNYPNQSYITLESAALNAAGSGGSPALTGSTANSPTDVNLTTVGRTDWVHWGRISDQPTDRKAGVVQKISGHLTVGADVSPTPGGAQSAASWSDGAPNGNVDGTKSSIRVFDKGKGLKVTLDAGTAAQTVKVWVGLKGRAQGQLKAVLSDSSRPAWSKTLSRQGSGQTTYEFTVNFAAASAGKTLTLSWIRTDNKVSASYLGLESVKLLGAAQPDPDPDPDPETGTGSIGDLVFADTNGDGLQGSGETGLPDVVVALRSCTGSVNLKSVVTDGNGNYRFDNLANGERYRVIVTAPNDFVFSPRRVGSNRTIDSDAYADGQMSCVRARDGRSKLQFDAGLVGDEGDDPVDPGDGSVGGGSGRIGDRVWNDSNGNGVQNSGESGIAGIRVQLLSCSNNAVLASVDTNASGLYRFTDIPTASYKLQFTAPAGRSFSPLRQGGSTQLDSDAKADGSTRCVQIRDGASRFGYDAGLN